MGNGYYVSAKMSLIVDGGLLICYSACEHNGVLCRWLRGKLHYPAAFIIHQFVH